MHLALDLHTFMLGALCRPLSILLSAEWSTVNGNSAIQGQAALKVVKI